MTNHLPECYWVKLACRREAGHFSESHGAYEFCEACGKPCICDRLRACEERVLEAAWEAVAAVPAWSRIGSDVKSDIIAVIDELRVATEKHFEQWKVRNR